MFSISEIPKMFQFFQTLFVGEKERKRLVTVKKDILTLFDDPKYERRRRSFRAIQQSLGIFEENPEELKKILFNLGARPKSGVGDKTLWELKENTPKDGGDGDQSSRFSLSTIIKTLIALVTFLAGIATILYFFGISFQEILEFFSTDPPFDLENCLNEAKQPLELDECHKNTP